MLAPFGIRPKGTLQARMLPLAQALMRRGWQVLIVAPAVQNPEDAGTRRAYAGVDVIHTPNPRLPGPAGVAAQVWALAQATLAEQPHLIHLFKPKGYSGLAALLAQALRPLPLVVDTDDWEGRGGWNDLLPYPGTAKLLFNWQEHDLPRRAAAVTVASRTLQTQVWGFGVAPERVFYLPNGVQPNTSRRAGTTVPSKQVTLLLYTRFWEFTLEPLIQALVAVFGQRPEARLLVLGKGEQGEEHNLLRLASRAGIAERIDYRGWVEPVQIPTLLASADIALAPLDDTLINRARGMAKLLELMQAGLPIVAQRVGAAAEYIEAEHSGLLTPPNDAAGFARAILRLLSDPALRERLGTNACARANNHFSWDQLALAAEAAYRAAGVERTNGGC